MLLIAIIFLVLLGIAIPLALQLALFFTRLACPPLEEWHGR